jgi:hypothetical protein
MSCINVLHSGSLVSRHVRPTDIQTHTHESWTRATRNRQVEKKTSIGTKHNQCFSLEIEHDAYHQCWSHSLCDNENKYFVCDCRQCTHQATLLRLIAWNYALNKIVFYHQEKHVVLFFKGPLLLNFPWNRSYLGSQCVWTEKEKQVARKINAYSGELIMSRQ